MAADSPWGDVERGFRAVPGDMRDAGWRREDVWGYGGEGVSKKAWCGFKRFGHIFVFCPRNNAFGAVIERYDELEEEFVGRRWTGPVAMVRENEHGKTGLVGRDSERGGKDGKMDKGEEEEEEGMTYGDFTLPSPPKACGTLQTEILLLLPSSLSLRAKRSAREVRSPKLPAHPSQPQSPKVELQGVWKIEERCGLIPTG
jgi:hypothetical protein